MNKQDKSRYFLLSVNDIINTQSNNHNNLTILLYHKFYFNYFYYQYIHLKFYKISFHFLYLNCRRYSHQR